MVLISESMNLMSSTTSKSGSKWSWGFRGVRSVTEGGEQELLGVASKPEVVFKLVPLFGEDRVTSSKSVGKAPPLLWPPPLASLLHQDGLTSCWWPPFCCCCCWSKLKVKVVRLYSRLPSSQLSLNFVPWNTVGDVVSMVILSGMRRKLRSQFYSRTEAASEPESTGQLARVWHDGYEALLE